MVNIKLGREIFFLWVLNDVSKNDWMTVTMTNVQSKLFYKMLV